MPGLAALLLIVVGVVLVLLCAAPFLASMGVIPGLGRREKAVKAEAFSPAVDTLTYHVPEGQDPAAVLAALETEGYAATLSPAPATHDVLIPCRSGADRERAHVRAVIAHASLNMEGDAGDHPVVFADERGGAV